MSHEHKKIDIVIIIPPAGTKNSIYPPYGAMYISSALRQKGYVPYILDADAHRMTNIEILEQLQTLNPEYIAFSGIVAPSYSYIKKLSHDVRKKFPDKTQILGGGLSSAPEPVLRNTSIDVIVCGEGDLTILELLECLKQKRDLRPVQGMYFIEQSQLVFTGQRKLIFPLDTLPYPAFDLVQMEKYMPDGVEYIRIFLQHIRDKRILDKKRSRRMITIPTSRGCFGSCSFCFRAYPGLRVHSMKYVFDLVEYCVNKYNVGFFNFGDECFAPNKQRNWDFIREYKRRNCDFIFRIQGMRVDTVDKDILRAYKDIGCWMIEYGFESGSQKMLNIINKRVSVEQNRDAAIMTKDAGIFTSPALILGMPGETNETINETIKFIKSLDFGYKQYQWKYPIAIPGSVLYEFAQLAGAITDEDKYLDSLSVLEASQGASFNINVTEQPDEVVAGWDKLLKKEIDSYYLKRKYKYIILGKIIYFIELLLLLWRRKVLLNTIRAKLMGIAAVFKNRKTSDMKIRTPRFKKNPDINIEDYISNIDHSRVVDDASLKSINKRIRMVRDKIKA